MESEMKKFFSEVVKNLFTVNRVIKIESVEVSQWLPIKDVETSWDLFLIRNEKGWVRTCICLANRKGELKLYDHNEIEIKGFNATEFMKINKPLKGKEYAIAISKALGLTAEDLK